MEEPTRDFILIIILTNVQNINWDIFFKKIDNYYLEEFIIFAFGSTKLNSKLMLTEMKVSAFAFCFFNS